MQNYDKLLQIVAAVHDSCFDAGAWTKALTQVASLLDSNGVVLALEDRTRGFAVSFEGNTVPEAGAEYLQIYHAIDPVIAYVRRAPVGRSYPDWMTIERADLNRTQFHNEFASRYDYGQCVQAFTHRETGSAGFFVAARPERCEPFGTRDRAVLDALIPHFEQALRIRTLLNRSEVQRVTALAALDRLSHGVFLVDIDLTILFANEEGRRLLRERDGLSAFGAKLSATALMAATELKRYVGNTCLGSVTKSRSILSVPRKPPRRPLLLRMAKLTPTMAEQIPETQSGACIFAHDPDRGRSPDPDEIRAVLDLTRAEARVAGLLAQGLTVDAISTTLGVSTATVRTQLSALFTKTNTNRQVELVHVIRAIACG